MLAILLAWAVDRQWRFTLETNERAQDWHFETVASFLKHQTPWSATVTKNGDVHFDNGSDHSTATHVKPEWVHYRRRQLE